LATVADTEAPDLRFGVVTGIDATSLHVSYDLRGAVEASVGARHRHPRLLPHLRRLFLAPRAAARGAALLHLAEVLEMPLTRPLPILGTCYDLIPLRYPRQYLSASVIADHAPRLSYRWRARFRDDAKRYGNVDRVVCISERTRHDLLELIAVPADRVDVVQTGVELSRYTDHRTAEQRELRRERPFVLYVGHRDWRKNIGTMFDAVRLVNRTTPLDFLWAGQLSPSDRATMAKLAKARGVTEHVKFLGFVPDDRLGPLYHDAVALLFLSRLEGFGLPVLEAMAAGCPAVVSRNSAADEVVGEAGFIVSPDDPSEAAGRIIGLIENPGTRKALGELGVRRSTRYNAPDMARGYIESYRRTLRSTSAPT
jgi:glycosyltransferase involved in cell wall biosynthesis